MVTCCRVQRRNWDWWLRCWQHYCDDLVNQLGLGQKTFLPQFHCWGSKNSIQMGMGSSCCLIWIFTGNKLWCNNIIWICGRNKRWEVGILIYVNLFFCNWRTNEAASRRGPFGTPFVLQGNLRVSGNILLMFQLNSQPGTLLLNLPCSKLAFRLIWRIQGYFPFCERGKLIYTGHGTKVISG